MVIVACDTLVSLDYEDHAALLDASDARRKLDYTLACLKDEYIIMDELKSRAEDCERRLSLLIAALA